MESRRTSRRDWKLKSAVWTWVVVLLKLLCSFCRIVEASWTVRVPGLFECTVGVAAGGRLVGRCDAPRCLACAC
jgi:hypothetical protein